MKGWRRAAEHLLALPALLQAGLGLCGIGAGIDLVYHGLSATAAEALTPLLGEGGARAHLATLLGMIVVFLGLVQRGISHGR